MQMVPAPGRVFKQVSMWALIALTAIDAAYIIVTIFFDNQLISAQTLASINGVLGAIGGVAKMIRQNIPMTEEQKADVIASVEAAPLKPSKGDPNV